MLYIFSPLSKFGAKVQKKSDISKFLRLKMSEIINFRQILLHFCALGVVDFAVALNEQKTVTDDFIGHL